MAKKEPATRIIGEMLIEVSDWLKAGTVSDENRLIDLHNHIWPAADPPLTHKDVDWEQ